MSDFHFRRKTELWTDSESSFTDCDFVMFVHFVPTPWLSPCLSVCLILYHFVFCLSYFVPCLFTCQKMNKYKVFSCLHHPLIIMYTMFHHMIYPLSPLVPLANASFNSLWFRCAFTFRASLSALPGRSFSCSLSFKLSPSDRYACGTCR